MTPSFIFDIDGTLINSVDLHAQAWQEAFLHFGKHIPFDKIRYQIGKGGDQLMPVFLSETELEDIGKQLEEFRSELWKTKYWASVKPFPCVRNLLVALAEAGAKLALASSAKADEVQKYKELAQIDDLLETETSSDEAEKSKPHPDIFLVALQKLGIGPADALVVGDTPYDIEAATRAGIRTIAVTCGGFPEVDLKAAGAVEVYRDPCDLLNHLNQILAIGTGAPR